uniref:CAP-Gly domain-containing protein n=1 Tax=Timema tahoe TaxID=61484 RepID=A0A7R9FGZ3_9NEOP|nr:unnamed protein product [Timema tahoe]
MSEQWTSPPAPTLDGTVGPATLKKTIPGVPKKKSLEDIEEGLQDGPEPGSKQRTISEDRQSSSGSLFAGLGNSRRGSEDVTGGRKHSSDITSIDALWEHVRRLSEAGVRRMSDASVILTEDTDSFIIGERVWVGGTKPGQIAYIGETQFAPGDWAGIVLDEPVGKNDGSVAGVRYFQCEMRRGVFSRLTRLTRSHLGGEEGDSVSALPRSNGSASGLTTPTRRLTPGMSPPGSVKDLQLRKGSLGDRVIIMSGQGSKAGTLKYRGTTEFAPGDWCGVELDDPVGKNDGSVEGVRYFKCEPKFGLFAPAHKLSKSPSSRRPSTCQVHQRPGSALKKVGSRESLTSVTSTTSSMRGPRVRLGVTSLAQKVGVRTPTSPLVAKTTLQDVLHEKEQHIERLLKERELERAEITRAAGQAENAEQKLVKYKLEFEQYKNDCEAKLLSYQDVLKKFDMEKKELLSLLEDEKHRVEDLQFRVAEESIMKGDIEVSNASNLERIRQLEESLAEERHKSELLEHDSNKLFEAEESLARYRDDLETLRKELDNARSKLESRTAESETETSQLKQELEKVKFELKNKNEEVEKITTKNESERDRLKKESDETSIAFKQQLEETTKQFVAQIEALQKQLNESQQSMEANNKTAETISKERDSEITTLRDKLEEAHKLLQIKADDLNKSAETTKEIEAILKKELDDTRATLKLKIEELDKSLNQTKDQGKEIEKLRSELENMQKSLASKTEDLNKQVIAATEVESVLKKQLEVSENILKEKTQELTKSFAERLTEAKEGTAAIKHVQDELQERESEISSLKGELIKLKEEMVRYKEQMKQTHAKEIEEKLLLIQQVEKQLDEKEGVLKDARGEAEKQQEKAKDNEGKVQALMEEKNSLMEKLAISTKNMEMLSTELQKLQLEVGDLQRKLQAADEKTSQITQHKQKLEDDISVLMNTSSDSSTQLSKLNSELREKERELDTTKELLIATKQEVEMTHHKLQQADQQSEKNEQDLKQKLEDTLQQSTKMQDELRLKLDDNKKVEQQLKDSIDKLITESQKNEEELKQKIENLLKEKSQQLEDLEQKLKESKLCEMDLKSSLNKITEESQKKESILVSQMDELKQKFEVAEKELRYKSELVVGTEQELRQKIEKMIEENKKKEQQLLDKHKEEIDRVKQEQLEVENVVKEKEKKIASLTDELRTAQHEKELKEKEVLEKETKLTEVSMEVAKLRQEKGTVESFVKKQDVKLAALTGDLSKLQETNLTSQKQLEERDIKLVTVNKQLSKSQDEKLKLESLFLEKDEKIVSLAKDLEGLKRDKDNIHSSFQEKNSTLTSITEELSQVRDEKLKGEISLKESEAKLVEVAAELTKLREEKVAAEKLVCERDEKLVTVTQEVDRLREQFNSYKTDLEGKLEQTLKEAAAVQDMHTKLESEKGRIDELQGKLQHTETERRQLSDRCEILTQASVQNTKLSIQFGQLQKELQESKEREQELQSKAEMEKATLQKMLEATNSLLAEKEKDLEKHKSEVGETGDDRRERGQSVRDMAACASEGREKGLGSYMCVAQVMLDHQMSSLQSEKAQVKQYRLLLDNLEREKKQLEAKVVEMQKSVSQSQANANNDDPNHHRLVEEKEFTQGQIDFLNSVIVDLHGKNDDLKARIEILEMGISPADANDMHLDGIKPRMVAPRLFCDICDVFDIHDTEDCPRQASSDSPPLRQNGKSAKTKAEPRPYCEICEAILSHSTSVAWRTTPFGNH